MSKLCILFRGLGCCGPRSFVVILLQYIGVWCVFAWRWGLREPRAGRNEPPSSAHNMTLPAFAAERRRMHVPIDLSAQLSSKALQPHVATARRCCCRPTGQTDRRTLRSQIESTKLDAQNGMETRELRSGNVAETKLLRPYSIGPNLYSH